MSNLGLYQTVTHIMKKCGGPKRTIVGYTTLAVGAGWSLCELKNHITARKKQRHEKQLASNKELYNVTKDFEGAKGLKLYKGSQIRILERDEDALMIEVLGDSNNPYWIGADDLYKISDFKDDGDK